MSRKNLVQSNQIVTLDDARTVADALRDGAVAIGAQWSARKTSMLELHGLCHRVIDERAKVAKRLKRHGRILSELVALEEIRASMIATLGRQLPDVDPTSLEARLLALVGSPVTEADRLGEVLIVTGGA